MDFISHIFEAGVVGCGGAGFPTHIKLKSKPEYFIVNGAECEPLLRTDRYIMSHLADKLIAGSDGNRRGASCQICIDCSEEKLYGRN